MSPAPYGRGGGWVDWEQRYDLDALRSGRVARATAMMHEAGLDALLLWKMENVRYLTSLRSQVIAGKASILNGALLLPGQPPVLLASGGEVDKARRFMPWLGAVHAIPIMEQRELVDGFVRTTLAPLLSDAGAASGRLGVDQLGVNLLEAIAEQLPGLRLADGDAPMQRARMVKLDEEIALVEEACAIGDSVTMRAIEAARVGARECEVAGDALQTLYYLGGEMAHVITPFVASGEHMSPPHRIATDKIIRNRDLCFIDIGAMWNGYFADIGRTTMVGRPSGRQKQVYTAVFEGLQAGIDAFRPGNTTEHVAAAVRRAVARHGLEDHLFSLFIGHGIGVGANEPPYIGETLPGATAQEFVPNMLFALEPLVWVEDSGGVGVRIEDMILVTDSGPRVLSRVEYDEALLA
ncbi:MAG TPA: Xaa-Pro peptidase family protein [Streptosporangiaceae bacterium]|nr:Xaa-Pro peptidase family protein [Streptosporangiaceae bacterium]